MTNLIMIKYIPTGTSISDTAHKGLETKVRLLIFLIQSEKSIFPCPESPKQAPGFEGIQTLIFVSRAARKIQYGMGLFIEIIR